jgi:hypothetical protein
MAQEPRSQTVLDRFNRWFVKPMDMLQTIPDDDGAFITLMASLVLYERYAKAAAKRGKRKATAAAITDLLMENFDVTDDQARIFWNMIRDGFLHQGMPLQGGRDGKEFPKWIISSGLPESVAFVKRGGRSVIAINPWEFRDTVVALYRMNPALLDGSPSFPWASYLENVTLDT